MHGWFHDTAGHRLALKEEYTHRDHDPFVGFEPIRVLQRYGTNYKLEQDLYKRCLCICKTIDIPIWSLYVFITVFVITTMIISYCRFKYWFNKFSYVTKNRTLMASKIGFSWHEKFHYTLGTQIIIDDSSIIRSFCDFLTFWCRNGVSSFLLLSIFIVLNEFIAKICVILFRWSRGSRQGS